MDLRPKRVAAYCRISMITERTELSLETQVVHYQKVLNETPGWISAGIYSDNGISGTSQKNRDGLSALLKDARDGKIDLILTKSVSRLARNTVDLLTITRELKDLGVEVHFEKEHLSTMTSGGELMLTLLASFAQGESEQRSKDVRWAVTKRFEEGRANGFHMYGYTASNDATDVQIVEEEAKVIRWIYKTYLTETSCETMAKILAEQGVRFPLQKTEEVKPASVRWALKNQAYTGDLLLGRFYSSKVGGGSRTANRGEKPMYLVENAIPAIISKDLWNAVQTERQRRRALGAKANWSIPTSTFTSKVYCSHCGKNYCAHSSTRKDGSKTRHWSCVTRRQKNAASCPSRSIRESVLKQIVTDALGLTEFDEARFLSEVKRIVISDVTSAVFEFNDGHKSTHAVSYPTDRDSYYYKSQEWKDFCRKRCLNYWQNLSPEEYKRQCEIRRRARGKHLKKKTIKKMRASLTPERRAKQAEVARRVNASLTPEQKAERLRKFHASVEANKDAIRARKSKRMKELWADPVWAEQMRKKQRKE